MSAGRAKKAIVAMRNALDNDNLDDAMVYALIFLAESVAADHGESRAEIEGRQTHKPPDPTLDESSGVESD